MRVNIKESPEKKKKEQKISDLRKLYNYPNKRGMIREEI
jgi:hypothetical protein